MENSSFDIISYFEENYKQNGDFCLLLKTLQNKYTDDEFFCLAEYVFSNKSDYALLKECIKIINYEKNKRYLPILVDFILKQTDDNNFLNLKVIAIKTISSFKDTSAVPSLLFCLNNKNSNYKLRLAAAEALGKIGDKVAFQPLQNVLFDEEEKSVYIKESAVAALGNLQDARAIDIFNSIINTKQMFLDKFTFLKERIVEAMSKLEISHDKQALEILKTTILDNSPSVRISAIETLMNSNISESYELIYDRLKFDDDFEVRKNALIALYNISDAKILKEVIKQDEYPFELKKYAKEIMDEYE